MQCRTLIGPPAKSHLNGVSLAGRLWPIYSGIWILYPSSTKNIVIKFGPPLTKLLSAHATVYQLFYLRKTWAC